MRAMKSNVDGLRLISDNSPPEFWMSSPLALMVASSDEHFREMVRDQLLNIPNAKIVGEYQEVAANLYIRVLQDLERNPPGGADRRSLGAIRRAASRRSRR